MLSSKNRAYLRGLANAMQPVFQVGKGGVGDEMCEQISNCLEARELIKLCVLENSGMTARDAADTIASRVGADVVAVIGRRFVLYRRSNENPKIELS